MLLKYHWLYSLLGYFEGFISVKKGDIGYENKVKYSCLYCQYSTSLRKDMAKHQVIHSVARPFRCDICQKNFSQKSSLGLHFRRFHQPR